MFALKIFKGLWRKDSNEGKLPERRSDKKPETFLLLYSEYGGKNRM